ncbi:MAG: endolytic transglycosylase MltG [Desulfuromonadales bacterium]|nr:endolytic transglycosylase MltG [Desulfuromonadales bacterium]
MKRRNLFIIIGLGLFLWLAAVGVVASRFLTTAVTPSHAVLIDVAPGQSFATTTQRLVAQGVVSDGRKFRLLARWRQAARRIKAGEYEFRVAATPDQVLARLISGDVYKRKVTIPEGFDLRQIAARVAAADLVPATDFLSTVTDPAFVRTLNIDAQTLEGYLFPETYAFSRGTSVEQIVAAMVGELRTRLNPELLAAAAKVGLDPHQLVTLASLIQKETGVNAEMPLISAVFHNRLNLRMPLQTDPTVIYGIENFDGNLTRRHLRAPTPYNTYTFVGLPPGPIAAPGAQALHAAAHPAETDALYFVAKGDGTHKFSGNLRDHNRAVRRYQLRH